MSQQEFNPLGHGGGLDADTIDGMHLEQILYKAKKWSGGLENWIIGSAFEKSVSFIIRDKDATTYEALYGHKKNQAGKIFNTNTDVFALINAIITDVGVNKPIRISVVKPQYGSYYNFATPLVIPTSQHGLQIIAEGWGKPATFGDPSDIYGVVFKTSTTGINAIELNGYLTGIILKDFAIWFAGASSGNGIDCSGIGDNGFGMSTIENVFCKGVDTGHYGFYIKNPFYTTLTNLFGFHGGYIKIEGSSTTYNFGNTRIIGGYWENDMKSVQTIPSIYFYANTAAKLNLLEVHRLQVNVKNSVATTPALKIEKTYDNSIYNIDLEGDLTDVITGVDARYNQFFGGYIYSSAGVGEIDFDNTSHGVQFLGTRFSGIDKILLKGNTPLVISPSIGTPSSQTGLFLSSKMTAGANTYGLNVQRYESWGLEEYLYTYRGMLELRKCNTIALSLNDTSKTVSLAGSQITDTKYGIIVEFEGFDAGSHYISAKSATQFTITWTNNATSGSKMHYWLFRTTV